MGLSRGLREIFATILTLVAIAVVGLILSAERPADAAETPRTSICRAWDDSAGEVIAKLAQAHNVDLRLVGDAIFRMRRARRSCGIGLIRLACVDYHAIIDGSPRLSDLSLPSSFLCSSPDGEPVGNTITLFTMAEE